MANLNAPMADAQIQKLDYFDKAQLYHNVYLNYTFNQLPVALRSFYTDDPGLTIVKAILGNSFSYSPRSLRLFFEATEPFFVT